MDGEETFSASAASVGVRAPARTSAVGRREKEHAKRLDALEARFPEHGPPLARPAARGMNLPVQNTLARPPALEGAEGDNGDEFLDGVAERPCELEKPRPLTRGGPDGPWQPGAQDFVLGLEELDGVEKFPLRQLGQEQQKRAEYLPGHGILPPKACRRSTTGCRDGLFAQPYTGRRAGSKGHVMGRPESPLGGGPPRPPAQSC